MKELKTHRINIRVTKTEYELLKASKTISKNVRLNLLQDAKLCNLIKNISDEIKFTQIRKHLGDRGICEMFDFEWNLIELFVRLHSKKNWRRFLPSIKKNYDFMMLQNTKSK